jgi:hypothetical protein
VKKRAMDHYTSKTSLEIKDLLNSVTSKLSASIDIWDAKYQKKAYLGIVIHFIDVKWNLHSELIGFKPLKTSHTGINICDAFVKVMDEWNIRDRLFCVTADNASNNDTFIEELTSRGLFIINIGILKSYEHHIRCFAHILNLALAAVLFEVKPELESVRKYVKKLKLSSLLLWDLQSICENPTNPTDALKYLMPILNCPTRWNSTFLMLDRILYLKVGLLQIFPKMSNAAPRDEPLLPIESSEWALFQILSDFLAPFFDMTVMVSGQKYPTLSSVIPMYELALNKMEEFLEQLKGWTNTWRNIQPRSRTIRNLDDIIPAQVQVAPTLSREVCDTLINGVEAGI